MKKKIEKLIALGLIAVTTVSLAACGKNGDAGEKFDKEAYKNLVFREAGVVEMENPGSEYMYYESLFTEDAVYSIYSKMVFNEPSTDEGVILPMPMGTPQASTDSVMIEEGDEVISEDGIAEDDIAEDDIAEDGIAEDDIAEDGIAEDDMAEDGEEGEILPDGGFDDPFAPVDVGTYNVTIKCIAMDFSGNKIADAEIALPEGYDYYSVCIDTEKNQLGVVLTDYEYKFYFYVYNMDGTEAWSKPFGNDIVYINNFRMLSDGKFMYVTEGKLVICDSELNVQHDISIDAEAYVGGIVETPAGEVYANIEELDEEGYYCMKSNIVDVETGVLTEVSEIPETVQYARMSDGVGEYDAIIAKENGIFGFDFADCVLQQIMGYVESDILYSYSTEVYAIDEETVYILNRNEQTWVMESISIMKKVPAEEVAEKDVLVLGMSYYDTGMAELVVDFNKKSETSRILIKDYTQESADWEECEKMLDNDIISGNMPDIVMLNNLGQINKYMEKGAFASLDSFLENDAEIDAGDMFPNLREALSYKDELYMITPGFYVNTYAMKSKYVTGGAKMGIEELEKLEAQLGKNAFFNFTKQEVLNIMFSNNYDSFIDLESGKCEFDEDFMALLEYASKYPEEINYDEQDYDTYTVAFRKDNAIIDSCFIYDFYNFNRAEKGIFGEEITMVGCPGGEGSGANLELSGGFAISDKSKHKDAAWQFIREFLMLEVETDEGYGGYSYGIPAMMSTAAELGKHQMKKQFYLDEYGNKVEVDDYFWMGDQEIVLEPITQDRVDYVIEYIKTVEKTSFYDEQIMNIIDEEAAPFFAGQKDAKQVTDVIQSRIQTYVNESR